MFPPNQEFRSLFETNFLALSVVECVLCEGNSSYGICTAFHFKEIFDFSASAFKVPSGCRKSIKFKT